MQASLSQLIWDVELTCTLVSQANSSWCYFIIILINIIYKRSKDLEKDKKYLTLHQLVPILKKKILVIFKKNIYPTMKIEKLFPNCDTF